MAELEKKIAKKPNEQICPHSSILFFRLLTFVKSRLGYIFLDESIFFFTKFKNREKMVKFAQFYFYL